MRLPFKNKPVKRFFILLLLAIFLIAVILFVLFIYSTGLRGNGIIDYNPSVYLLSDGFHSGIIIPNYNNCFNNYFGDEYGNYGFVHYTYAEKSWYLDMDRTFINAFPTLFTPTPGVIERTFIPAEYTIKNAEQYLNYAFDIDVWSFKTTGENLCNTIKIIEEHEIAEGDEFYKYTGYPGFKYDFFPALKKYTLFYNCHQFSLDMLSYCGLKSKGEWYICLDFLLRVYADELLKE